jgi:hypothetical protein
VAAALVADGQVARVAASAGALLDRQKRLVRLVSVVRSSLTSVVLKRSVGVIGLYVLIAIVFVLAAPNSSAALPVSPELVVSRAPIIFPQS